MTAWSAKIELRSGDLEKDFLSLLKFDLTRLSRAVMRSSPDFACTAKAFNADNAGPESAFIAETVLNRAIIM